MKLWILKPMNDLENDPWTPWYDKAFGFVVRAETEFDARKFAHNNAGAEKSYWEDNVSPWTDPAMSTCAELNCDGETGIIMRDFHAA